jgi:TetR/AcrR family transcriptional regulator
MVEERNKHRRDEFSDAEIRILDAAKKVFIRRGFAGARMQEIADEAEINKALLHYYFRTKEKLFEIIFTEAFKSIIPAIFEMMTSEIKLEDKVKSFFNQHIEFLLNNPFIPAFLIHEINQNPTEIIRRFELYFVPEQIHKLQLQLDSEFEKGKIRKIDSRQFILNILSLSIFPFSIRPLFQGIFQLSDVQWDEIIQERKTMLAEWIINSICI